MIISPELAALLPWLLFGSFAVLLLLRLPISYCLGIAAMLCLLVVKVPLSVIPQRIFASLDSFTVMAIPLFILAGNLMTEGGISKKLIDVANSVLGSTQGGLGMACVLACGFFGALSGSAPATVIAIGSMLYPEMVKMGYPKKQMGGLISVSGGLGPVIPPSICLVLYGTIANTSITDLFLSAFLIGGIMLAALLVTTYIQSKREKWPVSDQKFSIRNVLHSMRKSIWALLMPVIVLGGIYGGFLTPTEAASVAVVYALFISLFVYKELKPRDLGRILFESAKGGSVVLFIMATSSVFSWFFAYSGISNMLVSAIRNAGLGYYPVLLLMVMILLLFGFFLEGTATILLLIPIFMPLANSVGIHPLHLGMILSITNVVGCMTPPVAVNIFACSTFSHLSVEDISKGELPYLITTVLTLVIVVFFPQLSLWLPSLTGI